MAVYDFQKYKESKYILPHIEAILKILNLTEKSLSYFHNYVPVMKILTVLKEQKLIIQSYKDNYNKIKETKGVRSD